MMENIHLTINNDDLKKAVTKIISDKEPNKEEYVTLIHDLMAENSVACGLFCKLIMGGSLPILPNIGTMGYIRIKDIGYGNNIEDYEKFIQHGYLPVVVKRLKGLHNYGPIIVELPRLNAEEPGTEAFIDVNSFWPEKPIEDSTFC
jgi:hypothetical protein